MIPCYQICKENSCPYWSPSLLDCDHLPDDCDYAVGHLVSDRENQLLDGEQHGYWSLRYDTGQLMFEESFVNGKNDGVSRWWYDNGQLEYEELFVKGKGKVRSRKWNKDGQLLLDEVYENGIKQ